jgi:hypothetical protein
MDEFATWFKYRTGDDEPEIPVLPECLLRAMHAMPPCEMNLPLVLSPSFFDMHRSRYLVRKVETLSARIGLRQQIRSVRSDSFKQGDLELTSGSFFQKPRRSGKELWGFLAPRLGVIVTLQHQWGKVSDLYGTGGTMFESRSIPEGCK